MIHLLVTGAEAMADLGSRVGRQLRAGDLVLLGGDLGAGKTTLMRGIGAGLEVRGPITSPTFVLARRHPSLIGGPALVHVDAYRLGDVSQLFDLDLETDLADAVVAVEWGTDFAEQVHDSCLTIRIAGVGGSREVRIQGRGPDWTDRELTP